MLDLSYRHLHKRPRPSCTAAITVAACGGYVGPIVDRYYRMRFCCKAHMSAYKQRLTMETRAKIRQLELLAPT